VQNKKQTGQTSEGGYGINLLEKKFKKNKDNMGRTLGCKTCVERKKKRNRISVVFTGRWEKGRGKARKESGKSGRE
jgi:hypothetical protein